MRTRREPLDAAPDEGDPAKAAQMPKAGQGPPPERSGAPADPGKQASRRVRGRLLALVLVSLVAVLAVGTPGIVAAVGDLSESQRLELLARLNGRAVALSHSLADERDEMAVFVAGGRSTAGGTVGVTEDQRARVDRQAGDVRTHAVDVDPEEDPTAARHTQRIDQLLRSLPEVRQTAFAGPGSARSTFDAYSELIDALGALSVTIATELPGRASDEDTKALPALSRAVDHATDQRGLLLTALVAGGEQTEAVGSAQQSVVSERAAFADFSSGASEQARDRYAKTVTGKDVDDARRLVDRLTDGGGLSDSDLQTRPKALKSALTARIDRMRSVESSLAADAAERLRDIRDGDVVALEIRAGLTGAAALIVFLLTVAISRSVVRPLAGLHRAARDLNARLLPELAREGSEVPAPKPVKSLGRDEFRVVAATLNELQELAVRIHRQRTALAADHTALIQVRDTLAAERDALLSRQKQLLDERDTLQVNLHNTFVNLSMRTLSLVERQLALIERLEDREQNPDQLESLFRLDHLATRMRRNGENLLVLAGVDSGSTHREPVPLLDVMRAAISEIERYERVKIRFLPRVRVGGRSADDVGHLVAELLENATAFSPPQAEVEVGGWLLENGEVMLSVEDSGIGIPTERLIELNEQLAHPEPVEDTVSRSMGLFVVGRLARRYGIRVQLREMRGGGVTAVVVLPRALVLGDGSQALPARWDSESEHGATVPGQRRVSGLPTVPAAPPWEPVDLTESGIFPGMEPQSDGQPEPRPAPRGTSRRMEQLLPGTPPAGPEDLTALSPLFDGRDQPGPVFPGHTSPGQEYPALGRPSLGSAWGEHSRPDDATSPGDAPVRPKAPGGEQPSFTSRAGSDGTNASDGPSSSPPLTGSGLPKRVPRANTPPGGPGAPDSPLRGDGATGSTPRRGGGTAYDGGPSGKSGQKGVDAVELRRLLGGYQQGLREGRREAEAVLPPSGTAQQHPHSSPSRVNPVAPAYSHHPSSPDPSAAHTPVAPNDPEDGEVQG